MDHQNAVPATQDADHQPAVITLLQPTRGVVAKTYGPEGKRCDYDANLKLFRHQVVLVDDVDQLLSLIQSEAELREKLIIPGRIRPDAKRIVNRRKLPNPNIPYPPDVVDAPVGWACFDVDSLRCPFPISHAPELAASYVAGEIAKVIPGFDKLTCVVQASNSAGQPGNENIGKFHFWFLLDRSWSLPGLKEIIKQANRLYRERNPEFSSRYHDETGKEFRLLDDALAQATQPHYVANPKFVDGAVDPMPRRVWLEQGDFEYLSIDPADFPDIEATAKPRDSGAKVKTGSKADKGESTSSPSADRKKVTKPCQITGNQSRNLFFIRRVRKTLTNYGPQFDRQALAIQLRADLQKSKAEPADIQRWSTDAYLLREIENCIAFCQKQVARNFTLDPAHHYLTEIFEKYLPVLPSQPGCWLVKSPMNSGKTFVLKDLIATAARVLVLVHRQSLAKEVARRLKVKCYLDIRAPTLNQDKMVVCINSLHRVDRTDFDLVVVEESEQLLRSLANLPYGQRPNINHAMFRECISQARQVVALDAQMSNLTLNSLEYIRPRERFHIWRNSCPQDKLLRCYESRAPLVLAFDFAVKERSRGSGKPVAFIANSKGLVERQYERVRKDYPQLRCALITSRTTGNEDIQALLQNFDEVGGQYDVIFASPAISTGLSIERLDFRVFGAFDANVNCHTDAAQAISRFRLAKEVDVYVAQGKASIHSSEKIVEARLKALHDQDIPFLHTGSQPDFRVDLLLRVLDYEDKSRAMFSLNFFCLAEEAGWTIKYLGSHKESNIRGASLLEDGKLIEDKVRTERLQSARRLTDSQLEEINSKQLPTSCELDDKERSLMERFYYRPITPKLTKRDNRGAYQRGIRNLEMLREDSQDLLAKDRAAALGPDALPHNFKPNAMKKELWPLFLKAVGLPEDCQFERFRQVGEHLLYRSSSDGNVEQVFEGWSKDTLDPAALQAIYERRVHIKAFLGRSVPRNFLDEPTSFINQMLADGLAIPITSSRPRSESDTRTREYSLDSKRLQQLNADLLRRALGMMGVIDIDDPEEPDDAPKQETRSTLSSLSTSIPGGGPHPESSTTTRARRHQDHGKESQSPSFPLG